MSIDRLQAHYGFTPMPFSRDIPPQALHATPATAKRSPGSTGAYPNASSE